jgi:hypothetical protein
VAQVDHSDSGDQAEKIVAVVQRAAQDFGVAAGAEDADWAPLEAALPIEQCRGFMFMGYATAIDGSSIRLYKHGITRRYLMLDQRLRPYVYTERGHYVAWPHGLEDAIDRVFDGIERQGATRSTAYDDEYIAERDAALTAAGWRVVTAKVGEPPRGSAR